MRVNASRSPRRGVAEVEADLGRLRIELVETESRATAIREAAHARELAINRQRQQTAFDREQIQSLTTRADNVAAELTALESRREPARAALIARRDMAAAVVGERDQAAAAMAADSDAYEVAHREIEAEGDVEAARSEGSPRSTPRRRAGHRRERWRAIAWPRH